MRTLQQCFCVVVSIVFLLPVRLLAQQQPAGVVTTLQGAAELTRPTQPLPTSLRFKDAIFVRDVINTKEKSIARVLFGGKSTVTVRELSRLEVREENLPGGATRSIHELSSGAILVNVAKQLMRPGDEVQIRTPNAVAAVRGTILYVDCGTVRTNPRCNFTVLTGDVALTPQGRASVNLPANSTATVTGSAGTGIEVSPVTAIAPTQATQILQQFEVQVAFTREANQQQIAVAQAEQASQLARAVVATITGTDPGPTPATTTTTQTQETSPTGDQQTGANQQDAQVIQTALVSTSSTSQTGSSEITSPTADVTTGPTTAPVAPEPPPPPPPPPPSGDLTINNGDLFDFSSGVPRPFTTVTHNGGVLTGSDTVTASSAYNWTGGSQSGAGSTNIAAAATLTISGPADKTLDTRTLNNAGTAGFSGGSLFLNNGALFNNSGTFNAQDNTAISSNSGAAGAFNNSGTFARSGTGATGVSVPFNNNAGSVQINSGTLILSGGGTATGGFSGAGTLDLASNYIFAPGSSVTTSNVIFEAGTASVQGTYNLAGSSTTVSGGTANFTGTVGNVGNLTISAGTANFSSGETVAASSLTMSGGTLTGSDTVNVAGGTNSWTGGTQSGSGTTNVQAGATLDISGGAAKILDTRTLGNAGTTNVSGGNVALLNDAVINNSGSFNVLDGVNFSGSPGGTINNSGTFTKSGAGTSTTLSNIQFNNSGSADIQSGTLTLAGATNNSGSMQAQSGASLDIQGPFTNTGTVASNAGSTVNISNSGAHTGAFNVSGNLNLSNGLVSAAAGQTLNPTGTILNVNGGAVTANGSTPLFNLTGGILNVLGANKFLVSMSGGSATLGGRILGLSGGSSATVNSLFSLSGNSSLALTTALANVAGGSSLTITANSLGSFGAGTNTLNVNNAALCSTGTCVPINSSGFNILLTNGAVISNVSIDPSFAAFSGLDGSNSVTGVAGNQAIIVVDGASSTLSLGPNALPNLVITGVADSRDFSSGTHPNFFLANISGGTLTGSDTVTVVSSTTWTGGTQSGTGITNANGGLEISGAADKFLDRRTLNNPGVANFSGGGNLAFSNGAVLNNTGTFNALDNSSVTGTSGTFNNSGTFNKSGEGTTTGVSVAFNNANGATVQVNSGTLRLSGGGTGSGSFGGAGTLDVAGNYTFAPGSNVTTSNVVFESGTASVQGTYNLAGSSTTVSGGAADFTGTLGNVGNLTISAGTANFSSGETVAPTSLALSGGTLTGSDTVNLSGAGNTWTGGTQSGSGTTNVQAGATLNLNGLTETLDARALNNAGTVNFSGGSLLLNNGAVVNNTGNFNAQGDTPIISTAGVAGAISNSGTFTRSGDSTATVVSVPFTNTLTGSVQVNSGILSLAHSGINAGTMDVSPNAALMLANGASHTGTFNVSGSLIATNTFEAVSTAQAISLNGTLLNVTGGVVTAGQNLARLDGGSMTSTIAPFADLSSGAAVITTGSILDSTNSTLDFGAQPIFNLTGGSTLGNTAGPVIKMNGGTLTADVLAAADGTGNIVSLTGSVLDLTNATVTLRSLGNFQDTDTTSFNLAPNEPFITTLGSNLTKTGSSSLSELEGLFNGVFLTATDSTITAPGGLLTIDDLQSSATQPFIQVTNSQINSNSDLIAVGSAAIPAVNAALTGQLLKATGSTLNVNNTQVNTALAPIGLGGQPAESIAIINNEKGTTGTLDRAFVAVPGVTAQLMVIDANSNSVVNTITLTGGGNGPKVVAVTPNQDRVLVLDQNANSVFVIDSHTTTNTLLGSVATGPGTNPGAVAFTPDSNTAYIADRGTGTVQVMDLNKNNPTVNTIIGTITVGTAPDAVAITPNGTRAYVYNNSSQTVSVIDTATNTVVGSPIAVSGVAGSRDVLAITPDGSKVYVINAGSSNATVINTATNTTSSIPIGTGAVALTVTPDGSKVYVANSGSNNVSVISTATNSVGTIGVGAAPSDIISSKDGQRVYVANKGSNTVSVIDTATASVIATVNVGNAPSALALFRNRDLRNLMVVDQGSNDITAVDTVDLSDLVAIAGGSKLSSATSLSFLEFDPTTVNTGGALVRVRDSGSSLTLSGPLVTATDTTFNIGSGALRIYGGGNITGNGTDALIQLNGSSPGSSAVNTTFAFANVSDTGSVLSLKGPFLNATNTTFNLGPNATSADTAALMSFEDGAAISSTSTQPFVSLTGSTITHSSNFFNLRRSQDNVQPASTMSLQGPLASFANSNVTTTRTMFQVVEKATLTGNGSEALIQSANSNFNVGDPAINVGAGNSFFGISNNSGESKQGPASVVLKGGLLSDTGSTFNILDSVLSVTDGSTFTTNTTASPVLQFNGSTVTTGSSVILLDSLRDQIAPTMNLSGPLVSATNSTFNAGSTFFFVGDSAIFNGPGDAGPLMTFNNSTVNGANPLLTVRRSHTTGTPTTFNLSGPLLSASNGSVFNLSSTLLNFNESGQLNGSGGTALIQSGSGSSFLLTGNFLTVTDASGVGTPSPGTAGPAAVNLAGGLVIDTGSTFNIGNRFQNISGGATVASSSTTDAFATFSGSTVSTANDFTQVTGAGSKLTLSNSLLSANGTLNIGTNSANLGDVLDVNGGGQLVMNSPNPVLSLTGGTLTVGTADPTPPPPAVAPNTPNRIVRLSGVNTATDASGTFGTDLPVKGNGASFTIPDPFTGGTATAANPIGSLFQATGGANIQVQKGAGDGSSAAIRIDTALFEAAAPIINLVGSLTGQTQLTVGAATDAANANRALDFNSANVMSRGPVIALDKSLITVNNGPLLNLFASKLLVDANGVAMIKLANGSQVNVADLFRLSTASKINVVNGPLVLVDGAASSLTATGALATFLGSGGGNQIVVNNSIAPNQANPTSTAGIPVSGTNITIGAVAAGTTPIRNPGLGSISVNGVAVGTASPNFTGSIIQTTNGGTVKICTKAGGC